MIHRIRHSHGIEPLEFRIAPAFTSIVDLSLLDGTDGFEISRPTPSSPDGFSEELSGIGDINADGIDDFAVAAPGAGGTGVVAVIFGRSTGFPADLDASQITSTDGFLISGERTGDLAGASVAGLGDVNGDGIDDFAIGAPGIGNLDPGNAYVVFGQKAPFPDNGSLADPIGFVRLKFVAESPGDRVGATVASAGDFNDDGFNDLLIGAPGANGGAGTAYVIFGAPTPAITTAMLSSINGTNGFRMLGDATHVSVGSNAAGLGDVNGDGVDDIIVGSERIDGRGGSTSYVIYGRSGSTSPAFQLANLDGTNGFAIQGGEYFGRGDHVAGAGDINGDGLSDILIASGRQVGKTTVAGAFVVFGKSTGFPSAITLASLDGERGFRVDFGKFRKVTFSSVASAGDLNGDGFADIAVGSAGLRGKANLAGEEPNFGVSYVIFGHADPFEAKFDAAVLDIGGGFTLQNDPSSPFAVTAVRSAGDVNGDGLDDVMVGSKKISDLGAGYVVFGKPVYIATNPDADKVKFNDADGDLITVTAGGRKLTPNNFTFDPLQRALGATARGSDEAADFGLTLGTEFANSTVKVKAKKTSAGGGSGTASMSEIAAPGVGLKKVKIVGRVETIIAGNGQSAISKLIVDTLGPQTGVGLSEFSGPVDTMKIRDELRNATVQVNSDLAFGLKSLLVQGNVSNSQISSTGKLNVVVDGSIFDSTFDAATSLKLGVSGSIQSSLVRALGDTTSAGAAAGKVIKKLIVNGSVANSQILAGYSPLGLSENGAATIGTVKIKGDWVASDLVAGVDAGADGAFGTVDDFGTGAPFALSSKIARIVVKGLVEGTPGADGDHFGFVTAEIGSFKAGGIEQLLIEGPNNDLSGLDLGTDADVTVREMAISV